MALQSTGDIPNQQQPLYVSINGDDDQVKNTKGGYVYKITDFMRLQRFLIMGCEGGSYYAVQEKLEIENVECLERIISNNEGVKAVQLIKEISVGRRNVTQNSLLFAYAVCARSNDKDTKKAAYALLSEICRIPTHLFMFIKFYEAESSEGGGTSGWGRAHKRAISKWYLDFVSDPQKLARLVTKYKNRENWTHKDVLRLSHTTTHTIPGDGTPERAQNSDNLGFILRYIVQGLDKASYQYISNDLGDDNPIHVVKDLLKNIDEASVCWDPERLCYLIRTYKLTWEQCNSELLKNKDVWFALLPHMPIEAMIRNLGRLSSYGMFAENSQEEEMALEKIQAINTLAQSSDNPSSGIDSEQEIWMDEQANQSKNKDRNMLHPFKILVALITYQKGCNAKGSLTWKANTNIVAALDKAFYQAFEVVEPTNKKYFLAVDVGGSMRQRVLGNSNISCSMAAAAMMMVTFKTEVNPIAMGFSNTLKELRINKKQTLKDIMSTVNSMTMGSTDCAAPMKYAIENKMKDFDVFVIYTDNEACFGNIHPSEALREYRKYASKPDARLIVCGMCATEFSVADSKDPYMLDVVGFDSAAPRVISEFVTGKK